MIDLPICFNCRHFDQSDKIKNSCAAFPGGIPLLILESKADHRQPFKGDGGKTYVPVRSDFTLPELLENKNGE